MSVFRVGVPDREAEQDYLDILAYVNGCAEFISNCRTPMSIAVQGDWGSGKSSFMQMVRKKLEESADNICISFNTWQYSRLSDEWLFLPMLMHLETEIDRIYSEKHEKNKRAQSNYRLFFKTDEKKFLRFDKVRNLIKGFHDAAPDGVASMISGAGVVLTRIIDPETGEEVIREEKNLYERAEEALKTREEMQNKIDVLTGKKVLVRKESKKEGTDKEASSKHSSIELKDAGTDKTGRLVVFVDDLDRLKPDTAVNLLEDMKNFIDFEECVFVLAMDHHLVERGVEAKYGSSLGPEYARKFFEKIVQIPFYMPVAKYRIEKYIGELIEECMLTDLKRDEAAEAAALFTSGNPREIKRAVNAYQMYTYIHPEETHGLRTFVLLLLQMREEELYRDVVKALGKAPASERFEEDRVNESFDAFLKSRQNEAERMLLSYVKEKYGDADQLKEALLRESTAAESFAEMRIERDEVYYLLNTYFEEKGMVKKPVKNGNEFTGGGLTFRVTRYDAANHTTLTFTGGDQKVNEKTGRRTEALLEELENSGYLIRKKEETEGETFAIAGSDSSVLVRIRKEDNHALFVRKVTANPQVLHLIGKITNLLLKGETK